jgi:hypothetical protein
MSESKDEKELLGKKRELEKDDEDKENSVKKQKERKKEGKPEEKDNDESSSSSPSQPKKSLFSNKETGFKGGLFGDLDNPNKAPTSLFANSSGGSLFGNTSGSLFGNIESKPSSNSLFSGGLFDFSKVNSKKEEEENNNDEGEGDDNIGKSNSPKHEYNPEKEETEKKEDKDGYIKRYAKKVDNATLYDKLKKTFVSRGEGFIIIETQEKENSDNKKERFARIVYRNLIGGIIFQGVIHDKINKCVKLEKKLKHICHIVFLTKEENNEELSLAQAKIVFSTQDEIDNFSDKFNNTIKYIKNEIDDF